MATDPLRRYQLRHATTGRWIARVGALFHWHRLEKRACVVRGGPKLDAMLVERPDVRAVELVLPEQFQFSGPTRQRRS